MKIVNKAAVGTLESCDCLVMVKPGETLEIHLNSIVEKIYGTHIRKVILKTLEDLNVNAGVFIINDRGALDYCLNARVTTAVKRGVGEC